MSVICLQLLALSLTACQSGGVRDTDSIAGTWVGGTSCSSNSSNRYAEFDISLNISTDNTVTGTIVRQLAMSKPSTKFTANVENGVLRTVLLGHGGAQVRQLEVTFNAFDNKAVGRLGASRWCPVLLERS